jgi:hypothetical protein
MADKLKTRAKAHTRYYTSDGELVVGVTTVCGLLAKPQLIKWANNLGLQGIDSTKYVDASATVGTLIHYLVECHIKGENPDLSEYSQADQELGQVGFNKFLEWEKEHKVEYIASELSLVSDKNKFGGTIDCIAKVDGELTLIDFKSGSGIYKEYYVQTSAYKELAKEKGYKVKRIMILNIGRNENETFKVESITSQASKYYKIFKALKQIYYIKKELKWN